MIFEEKIKAMTFKEILGAMLDGMRKEWVKLNFNEWVLLKNGVCVGCAATNTICEIMQKPLDPEFTTVGGILPGFVGDGTSKRFIKEFELAIDFLRSGLYANYNIYAKANGFATMPTVTLPLLNGNNWKKTEFDEYVNFYNTL